MPKKSDVHYFIEDITQLCELPVSKKYRKITLPDYPFDAQLLNLSPLYQRSRQMYLKLGGTFSPRVCSTMRALSAQDLFKDEIEFTPSLSEMLWFKDHGHAVSDANEELAALSRFNEISLFHEQNHRVIWRLLPPAPKEQAALCRYLNFAESLVVTLDLVLGDQLGKKLSPVFERMKVIYRAGGEDLWFTKSKKEYRQYLLAALSTTYYALEILHDDDILGAVNYVLPGQKAMNKTAHRRGMQLSEIFTRVTNPQWQSIYWKSASTKLQKIQKKSKEPVWYFPEDPLDLHVDFQFATRIFDAFGI